MARHLLAHSLSLLLLGGLGSSVSLGCERADADIVVEEPQQADAAGSGGTTSPVGGLGGAVPDGDGDMGDGDTGDGDLFAGSCPVEPCDVGDGDGDGDGPAASANLVTNPDFSSGDSGWNGTNGSLSTAAGTGCVSRDSAATPILGWDSVTIDAGSYTFAFDVVGAGTSAITAKVGGTTDPWTAFTEQELPAVSAGRQSFDFTMTGSATVGLAFIFTSGDACIDNVSLVKN